ncbi:hypothetical protein L1987_02569 [Smallanthus sonchifolius]|uniref:Uncharacterized protein n=1 Tax=Smallanthus sonchifolius TaxID=185202 RepID=A0ACB9K879_9ASTR|nr:hypothetical protein L1987_02569 [Smallanthus sonchifolius]
MYFFRPSTLAIPKGGNCDMLGCWVVNSAVIDSSSVTYLLLGSDMIMALSLVVTTPHAFLASATGYNSFAFGHPTNFSWS